MDQVAKGELACRCGCGFGSSEKDLNPKLLLGLQKLHGITISPIVILSGCRCAKHNRKIGGVPDSQHVWGTAADVTCPELGIVEFWSRANQVPEFIEGGLGLYTKKQFVHVDVRGHRARWTEME